VGLPNHSVFAPVSGMLRKTTAGGCIKSWNVVCLTIQRNVNKYEDFIIFIKVKIKCSPLQARCGPEGG